MRSNFGLEGAKWWEGLLRPVRWQPSILTESTLSMQLRITGIPQKKGELKDFDALHGSAPLACSTFQATPSRIG